MNFQRQIDGFPNIGTSHKKALEYRANKERAYSEGFAEFINTAERYYLAGKEYFVHPNVNLYLDMTAYCSSDCQFCIAKTTYERNNIPKYEYEESLHRALDVLRDVEPSIQIVGGEPTTDIGKLELILSVIKERNIKRPVLGTNGYWLFHLTGCINDGTLEYLNLSRHHYRDDINEEIMGGNVTCTDDLAICQNVSGRACSVI